MSNNMVDHGEQGGRLYAVVFPTGNSLREEVVRADQWASRDGVLRFFDVKSEATDVASAVQEDVVLYSLAQVVQWRPLS